MNPVDPSSVEAQRPTAGNSVEAPEAPEGLPAGAGPEDEARSGESAATNAAGDSSAGEGLETLNPLVLPFRALCPSRSWAVGLGLGLVMGPWVLHALLRVFVFPEDFYVGDEMTLLTTFVAAVLFSLLLPQILSTLCQDLTGQKSSLADVFQRQYGEFHRWPWVVAVPAVFAAIAIIGRYVVPGQFSAFNSRVLDGLYSVWLLIGFYFVMVTTVLCARYTEVVKLLEPEAESGMLGRGEIHTLSRFYLKLAIIATVHFGLCAMLVYSIHMIYSFRGMMPWSGFQLVRFKPGLSLGAQVAVAMKDPLFFDVLVFFFLHGAVSIAPAVYLILPQWGIHRLLVRRKESLLTVARARLDEAEERLRPDSPWTDYEAFSHISGTYERIGRMPEWPFDTGGKLGTLLLVGVPSLLLLGKEVIVELLVALFVK